MRISDWSSDVCSSDLACVVLRVRGDGGPDILTFTEAGTLARFGFNGAGIAVTGNYLECERDYTQIGVPLALIRRKVLQQDNPSLAFDAIYSTAKSASNNLALSHARSEEHTSELQSLMRTPYAVFCLKKTTTTPPQAPQ